MPGLLAQQNPLYDAEGHPRTHATSKARTARPRVTVPDAGSPMWRDFIRGRTDPVWWSERFLGIRLNRGQRRWVRACAMRAPNGWSPAFLTTVVSAGNRAGKTLAMAIVIAHHCFYKLGLRPPRPGDAEDSERWNSAPYVWYHVGIQQETAEIVYNELVSIFEGRHPAQYDKVTGKNRRCPLTSELGSIISWDKRYRGEYQWIRFHPYFGGAEIHFRTTESKAKALLGKDMNGISFDEAAFEMYLDTIRHEVLNLRRLSTGGPLHFIGTPTEGHNDYYDLWSEGDPANPNRDPRVISFTLPTTDNIGYGLDQEAFDAIAAQTPDYLYPQNILGQFIEARDAYFSAPAVEACFSEETPDEAAPQKAHRYVQGVDPGIAADATWAITLDYTRRAAITGVRAVRKRGRQQLPAIVNMVREGHLLYSQDGAMAMTVVDSTGLGGKMFKQEFSIIRPCRDFDFAGTKAKKLELLSDLKALIDRAQLRLPAGGVWGEVRRQLLGYKLADQKLEQDAVMALAIAVRHALRNAAAPPDKPTEFRYFGD